MALDEAIFLPAHHAARRMTGGSERSRWREEESGAWMKAVEVDVATGRRRRWGGGRDRAREGEGLTEGEELRRA
nr:unnamed protein product [Digitaria exilis]